MEEGNKPLAKNIQGSEEKICQAKAPFALRLRGNILKKNKL